MDDDAMEAYLDGVEPDADTIHRLMRKACPASRLLPGAVRLGLQEQGRSAPARCGRRLSSVSRSIPAIKGLDSIRKTARRWFVIRPTTSLCRCWRSRSWTTRIRRHADVCRIYSGKVESGANVINTVKRDKKERVGRMLSDARQQPRRREGSLHRRYRCIWLAHERLVPAIRCATRRKPSSSRRWSSPSR